MIKLLTVIATCLASLFWPQTVYPYPHRGVLLDCARKYYTPDWICDLIDQMSASGANELILHFSENEGLRIKSENFPWLTADEGDEVYSHEDIRALGAYAQEHGITLIPSFDTPGHLQYILDRYKTHEGKDIALSDAPQCLNITDPDGIKFIRTLIDEYASLFKETGSTQFDMGGDEVFPTSLWENLVEWQNWAQFITGDESASSYDAFITYMNDTNRFLKERGYTCRMYNDQLRKSNAQLDEDITIEYWECAGQLPEKNPVLNYLNFYLYYILDPHLSYPGVDPAAIRREWTPAFFLNTHIDRNRVVGSSFCIWSDIPECQTQDEVMEGIKPLLAAWSEKCGK